MERTLSCPWLGRDIRFTEPAYEHVLRNHPEVLPGNLDRIRTAIESPDRIHRSRSRPRVVLFSRWYDDLLMGKYLVVVVDVAAASGPRVLTSYVARAEPRGEVLWPSD